MNAKTKWAIVEFAVLEIFSLQNNQISYSAILDNCSLECGLFEMIRNLMLLTKMQSVLSCFVLEQGAALFPSTNNPSIVFPLLTSFFTLSFVCNHLSPSSILFHNSLLCWLYFINPPFVDWNVECVVFGNKGLHSSPSSNNPLLAGAAKQGNVREGDFLSAAVNF